MTLSVRTGWNLDEITEENRDTVVKTLKGVFYENLLKDLVASGEDLSHPLVYVDGVLRWKSTPWVCEMKKCGALNLNANIPDAMRRALNKHLGYSLTGYAEIHGSTEEVQGW